MSRGGASGKRQPRSLSPFGSLVGRFKPPSTVKPVGPAMASSLKTRKRKR